MMTKTDRLTNLELRRRMAGYSKRRLGKESGVHYLTIISLEQKGQKPRHSTLFALAHVLGCTPDDLKGFVDA
jgi:transcriptional regulator with XRE-family HTH domain